MAMQRYTGVVQDTNGNALSGVSVTVRLLSSGNVATIYSDEGTTPKTNPLTSAADGSYSFYAADGDYSIATADSTIERVTLFAGDAIGAYRRKEDDLPTKNNDTVLEDDSTLVFPVGTSETWSFHAVLRVTTAAAAGFDFKFTIPAGTIYTRKTSYLWDGTTIRGVWNTALDTEDSYAGAVAALADDILVIMGTIVNGTTAGDVQLQYAQNIADVSNTNVLTGSWMNVLRVG